MTGGNSCQAGASRARRVAGKVSIALALLMSVSPTAVSALSLREAVSVTLDSNPQIGAAIENREAIEFELRQARGLYMPRLDFETSVGSRRLESPQRVGAGYQNDTRNLMPAEAGLVATWKLFDGFGRDAEVERQASRVDGASFRVLERSEFLALEVAREYFEIMLQERIVGLAQQNVRFHEGISGRIRENVNNGSLTDADLKQGEERLLAARARLVEARQELAAGKVRFLRLVGMPFAKPTQPSALGNRLPRTIDAAMGVAVKNNPRLKMANADIDAAGALIKASRSRMYPELFLEGRARGGHDLDGSPGRTNDLQARAVMRWNLFNGGIDQANIQEQTRRFAEAQQFRDQTLREIQESVRLSWDRRDKQVELSGVLARQVEAGNRVVAAYDEQFQVGRRSLLDLLDAQNTRYNSQVLLETSRTSAVYSEYRIMASTGQLVATLGLKPPAQADAYARPIANVPPSSVYETAPRYSPSRNKPWEPAGSR